MIQKPLLVRCLSPEAEPTDIAQAEKGEERGKKEKVQRRKKRPKGGKIY